MSDAKKSLKDLRFPQEADEQGERFRKAQREMSL